MTNTRLVYVIYAPVRHPSTFSNSRTLSLAYMHSQWLSFVVYYAMMCSLANAVNTYRIFASLHRSSPLVNAVDAQSTPTVSQQGSCSNARSTANAALPTTTSLSERKQSALIDSWASLLNTFFSSCSYFLWQEQRWFSTAIWRCNMRKIIQSRLSWPGSASSLRLKRIRWP